MNILAYFAEVFWPSHVQCGVWMHTSGLWLPLRVRNLNHVGCRAKAGTVPKDLSTLKSERAGVKAVTLRAIQDVTAVMPAGDPPEFTAPSHPAN